MIKKEDKRKNREQNKKKDEKATSSASCPVMHGKFALINLDLSRGQDEANWRLSIFYF